MDYNNYFQTIKVPVSVHSLVWDIMADFLGLLVSDSPNGNKMVPTSFPRQ